MTQEQKDLLLKDLCGRLPYGVKLHCCSNEMVCIGPYTLDTIVLDRIFNEDTEYVPFDEVKPYLFPLSSMTDEQCEELRNLIYEHFTLDDDFNEGIRFKTYGDILVWLDEKPINKCYFIFDWFHKNHFDYRGLIHKGSAIDATGKNIY